MGFSAGGGCRRLMRLLLTSEAIVGAVALLLFQLFPVQLISLFGMENAFFGVLVSMPCSAILTFIATAFVILSTARRLRRLEKEKTEAQPAQEE